MVLFLTSFKLNKRFCQLVARSWCGTQSDHNSYQDCFNFSSCQLRRSWTTVALSFWQHLLYWNSFGVENFTSWGFKSQNFSAHQTGKQNLVTSRVFGTVPLKGKTTANLECVASETAE